MVVADMKTILKSAALAAFSLLLASPLTLRAHCDTLNGPVVNTARDALGHGDVTPVLKWVRPSDEAAIRSAFDQASVVRKQSKEAAALADQWFFETLVRIHRAGEGAPYTGLKAATELEPSVAAADEALASGDAAHLLANTIAPLQTTLQERFTAVKERQAHAGESVEAGRRFVAAYVEYVHLAERIAGLAEASAHEAEEPAASGHAGHSGHSHE